MKTNKVTGSRGVMYICGFFLNFDYCEIVFQYNLFSSAIGKVVSIMKVMISKKLKAIPHRDCASDAPPDFSSDCTETTQEYCRISRSLCAI